MRPSRAGASPAGRPARRGALLLLICGLAILGSQGIAIADEGTGVRGRRLVDVLGELQRRGLDLVYSSAVVGEELRVRDEPEATEPRALLEEILPPLDLRAEEGPSGSILILPALAQTGALKGRVVSLAGGMPIAGASLLLPMAGLRARSASDGSFELRGIPVGTHKLRIEAPGFSPTTLPRVLVGAAGPAELTVELEAQPVFVTEVVVTPSRHSVVRQEQAPLRTVTGEEAILAPTIGGDISRVVELLPGVAAPDHSAAFNVRGSVAADVSWILDGLELYDPFHLQSFQSPFSLIDTNVVDRIDFFGGGFTADLGDRHGGFVEISTLAPQDPGRGEAELGTLNSRFSYRAPHSTGGGAWLVSLRGWYPEAVRDTTELGAGENLSPRFADLYAKTAFHLPPRHRLSLHGLLSYDRLSFDETGEEINESVDAVTRNGYLWLRAASAWSEKWSSETVVSGGRIERIRDGISAEQGELIVEDSRSVHFLGLKHDARWRISEAQAIKAGAEVRWLEADYRYLTQLAEDPDASPQVRLEPEGASLAVYAAHRARISPTLAVEIGGRWDRQNYTNDNQLSPRFNAVWRPGDRSEMRLALGRFNQSQRIHELRVEDGERDFGRAEVAEQAELSFQHGFGNGLRLRLDAYYRRLSKLRPRYENLFEPIELFPETTADRVRVAPERARLRGVELLLRGEIRRPLFWWASYALSSAEDLIDHRAVPRSWDQTQALKFLVGYRRNERWSVSLGGSAHTGWPTTPVTAESTTLPDGSTEYEAVPGLRNSDRFADYVRLDLKLRRSFRLPRGRLWLTLDVVNLTDRDNECCINEFLFEPREDGSVDVRRDLDYWLGITPSFSALWEF